jgi:hypothetical protein
MRHWGLWIAVFVLGCGEAGTDGGGRGLSGFTACVDQGGICMEASDWMPDFEAQCLEEGLTVVDACPREDVLGICFGGNEDGLWTATYYYIEDAASVAEIALACTTIGATWTAY